MTSIEEFRVTIGDGAVADLRDRLARTRWPDRLEASGWELGTDLGVLRELCDHWRRDFDWQRFEDRCNRYPQVRAVVDGIVVHAMVARSGDPSARRPLLLLHGWPGSVAEYFDVIELLAGPHHVVVASLPGYGFSGPTTRRGVDQLQIGRVLVELMGRLGFPRFVVAGGDWGATIGGWMGAYLPEAVAGLHMTMVPMARPDEGDDGAMAGVTADERQAIAAARVARRADVGFSAVQSTRPQTLAYGLTDSPAGLAAWIIEKFHGWSDCGGNLLDAFSMDRLLDNISIYWFTGTINSSMRLYRESGMGRRPIFPDRRTDVPTAVACYPADIYPMARVWAERQYAIVRWRTMERGGHFPAMEVPGTYATDVAEFIGALGSGAFE